MKIAARLPRVIIPLSESEVGLVGQPKCTSGRVSCACLPATAALQSQTEKQTTGVPPWTSRDIEYPLISSTNAPVAAHALPANRPRIRTASALQSSL